MTEFQAGQVWLDELYRYLSKLRGTRAGEEGSRVTILRVEPMEGALGGGRA